KKCGRENAPRILIDTHFDEIGMYVSEIHEGGFLSVVNVGGLDTRILQAEDVVIYGKKMVKGVIASTPPHLARAEDKGTLCTVDKLLIDTGYSKEEISSIVSLGTPVGFAPKYTRLGDKMLAGKGFDNKACAACAVSAITKTAREALVGDVYLLLSAHEETDRLGGVVCGAYRVMPNYAMVIDVNLGRTPDTPTHETVELGKGISVTLSAVTDRKLSSRVFSLAEEKKLPVQKIVSASSTGTNAETLGLARGGIPTVDVGLPLKSMHTYNEVLHLDDCQVLEDMIAAFICDHKTAEVFS
ncbi:MAG: hypothetical protein J6B12_03120, partial [Clostridia bacterium]|nr:hypothetical protein [Clostridia bacterium]